MSQTKKVRRPLTRKEAFFGLHFDLHPEKTDTDLGAHITEEMIERLLREVEPDYIQYDCKGHPGYTECPTKVGWAAPGIRKDSLAIWREVTRRHHVPLFIHYSGVWDSLAVKRHPDWACVNADGEPDRHITSIFGPYIDELMIPQLKEVTDAYDLDGYWIDGDCWGIKPDWSEAARQAFTAETGIEDIPIKYDDPHWHQWLAFHRRQFAKYLRRYLEILHSHKPEVEIACSWMYTARAPEPVEAKVDFLSGDLASNDAVNWARFDARYISSVGMPWDLMAWGFNHGEGYSTATNNLYFKPAIQLMQEAAVVLAQGGGFQIYYKPTRAGWVDRWIVQIMAQVARFCRARQAVSHKSQTIPQIALLFSTTSFFAQMDRMGRLYSGSAYPTEYNAIQGILQALLELHYSVDILPEHRILGRMSEYPLIVLPECEILTDELQGSLLDFVLNGGSLLAIGARTAGIFKDHLGVRFDGDPAEASMFVRSGEMLGWLGGLWQDVTRVSAKSVGTRFPTSNTRRNGGCAATANNVGKGLIGAIYGSLGDGYYNSHMPAVRNFLGDVVSHLFQPMVDISGPPCIDVTLRRKDGKMMIHLANTAGIQTSAQHTVVDFVPPVGPVELVVHLPEQPERVLLVPRDVRISSVWDDCGLHVKVPELRVHSVIVLE